MPRPIVCLAPLQGYTNAAYRRVHFDAVGGIDYYYTPFVRWEKGGLRNKDLRDIDPKVNAGIPVVPQVIARDCDELRHLCDELQALGWRRIDINMGCPFPMQTGAGRGCGLLSHPDIVASILEETRRRPEVAFSVKMRLGQKDNTEAQQLLPILNETPLENITLHPRIGRQQYRGKPDIEAFSDFYKGCKKPLIYNGDITTREDIERILQAFPALHGVMIGRGLLANPTMLLPELTDDERLSRLLQMHDYFFVKAQSSLQGDQQLLTHLHAFWQYPQKMIPKKTHKELMKTSSLRNYLSAVESLRK
ncbi:MAG: tRNA-dihydrouridine synthase family protein [Bacteroidales bacterium]|nr:tRNA-dihydrouridine synthase family protein [Bacteroidales bacterium]